MSKMLDSALAFPKTARDFPKAALEFLKGARDHIQKEDRYRLYPLYALALIGVQHLRWLWPFDTEVVRLGSLFSPWAYDVGEACSTASLVLALLLALVGVWRRPMVAKALSIWGIYLSVNWLTWGWVSGIPGRLWTTVLWYTFDLPTIHIEEVAIGNAPAQTTLWFIYLLIVWLAVRPLLKRSWRGVLWIESKILAKWPVMQRLERPLL